MPFLPEWAPNVHPMLVHFPIALLFTALLFDLGSKLFRNINWLRYIAAALYIFGAITALITYLSGEQAADQVKLSAMAEPVLTEHEDWALLTVWFFGLYGVLRLVFIWKRLAQKQMLSWIVLLVGAIGLYLLYETAEHGAELVFRHGVGVLAAQQEEAPESGDEQEALQASPGATVVAEDNGWRWNPGEGAEAILEKEFLWHQGDAAALTPVTVQDSEKVVLMLTPQNSVALFTAGSPLKNVQIDAHLNLAEFEGEMLLVHHFQDSLNYDFAGVENRRMILGRLEEGKMIISDQGTLEKYDGWITLKVVGDGGHFRAYLNDRMIAHGHGRELPAGPAGFRIRGSGKILLDEIKVQPLGE